jgi:hypothetical protein
MWREAFGVPKSNDWKEWQKSGKKFPMFGTFQRKDAEVAEFATPCGRCRRFAPASAFGGRKAGSLRSFSPTASLRLLPLVLEMV